MEKGKRVSRERKRCKKQEYDIGKGEASSITISYESKTGKARS